VQHSMKIVGDAEGTGTTITFHADAEIFGDVGYDFNTLSERFREMAYLNKGLEIYFSDERTDQEKTFYFEGGITSFVRHLNRNRGVIHKQPICINKQQDSTIVEVAMQYNDGYAELIYTFANCINTVDGGTHLTGFRAALTRAMNDYARKNKLIKEDEPSLTGDDVREGLTAIISVKLSEPQFEGQTKGKLGNIEVKSIVESVVGDGLGLYLEEHPDDGKAGSGAQGPRFNHPQEQPGHGDTPRQAGGLLRKRPGFLRAFPGRGRLGRRLGQAGTEPALPGNPALTR
jgi:DNA gyrase subunit B